MSSLSNQLASLHSKTGKKSSKDHHDGIGRGIHHSSKHGHSLIIANNTRNKPSILLDSRSAAKADIPLTTLRENALVSLQYLSEHSSSLYSLSSGKIQWSALVGPKSVKFERGLNTPDKNGTYDMYIREALFLLSSSWGDTNTSQYSFTSTMPLPGTSIPSSILHIIEYFLQKYQIHVHNAETFVVAFLPHHETRIFERILQLVDLTEYPYLSFLRPYSAIVGAKSGIPRTVIAKWGASTKDNGGGIIIVKKICEVAKKAAKLSAREKSEDYCGITVRRGISYLISFAAAIVGETLHLQSLGTGSIDENSVRCLLPYILSAIEPSASKSKKANVKDTESSDDWSLGTLCSEWRSFGYIVLSILAEKCEINEKLRDVLATTIITGCTEKFQFLNSSRNQKVIVEGYDDSMSIENESSQQTQTIEMLSESVLALMALINYSSSNNGDDKYSSYLPKVETSSTSKMLPSSKSLIGCDLPHSACIELSNIPNLPQVLGCLMEERNILVTPLLAAYVADAMKSLLSPNSNQFSKYDVQMMDLLVDMIKEPTLRSIWTDSTNSLTVSATALLLLTMVDVSNDETVIARGKTILESFRQVDIALCDTGVAHSITKMRSNHINVKQIKNIALLLGDEEQNHLKFTDSKEADSAHDHLDRILPARIALEHPDALTRKLAIKRLLDENKNDFTNEELCFALLRRLDLDDNEDVLLNATRAIVEFYNANLLSKSFVIGAQEQILRCLQRWGRSDNSLKSFYLFDKFVSETKNATNVKRNKKRGKDSLMFQNMSILTSLLYLAGFTARTIVDESGGNTSDQFDALFLQIIHHISDDCDNDVRNCGRKVLSMIFENTGEDDATNDSLCRSLLRHHSFTILVEKAISELSKDPNTSDRKFELLWFYLSIIDGVDNIVDTHSILDTSISTTLALINNDKISNSKTTSNEAIDHLIKRLKLFVDLLSNDAKFYDFVHLLVEMTLITSNDVFELVSKPILKHIENKITHKYHDAQALTVVVLEAASLRSINSLSNNRLLAIAIDIFSSNEVKVSDMALSSALLTCLAKSVHDDLKVREGAIQLVETLATCTVHNQTSSKQSQSITSLLCAAKSSFRSNILMIGSNSLPNLLRQLLQTSCETSKTLLQSCIKILSIIQGYSMLDKNQLSFPQGFSYSIHLLLDAFETTGEHIFPLHERWDTIGKELLSIYLKYDNLEGLSAIENDLLGSVILMLKGITAKPDIEAENLLISTGPGRRRRAYSFGISDSVTIIDPYPKTMIEFIVKILSFPAIHQNNVVLTIIDALNELVLCRNSWSRYIFPKLDENNRKNVVLHLFHLKTDNNLDSAEAVLMKLPLNVSDISHITEAIKTKSVDGSYNLLCALMVVADIIKVRSDQLAQNCKSIDLFWFLLDQLSSLSKTDSDMLIQKDSSDYTRTCLLRTLVELYVHLEQFIDSHLSSKKARMNFDKKVGSISKLLVSLVGETDMNVIILLSSSSKSLVITLLTSLCATSPEAIIGSLVSAMTSSLSSSKSSSFEETVKTILPAYCAHAGTVGLSIYDLLLELIKSIKGTHRFSSTKVTNLFCIIADSLVSHSQNIDHIGIGVATILVLVVASGVVKSSIDDGTSEEFHSEEAMYYYFASKLLGTTYVDQQIHVALQIVRYSTKLMTICNGKVELTKSIDDNTDKVMIADAHNICKLAITKDVSKYDQLLLSSTLTPDQISTLIQLIHQLITIIQNNIFVNKTVKIFIQDSDDKQARISLNLWHELITFQALFNQYRCEIVGREEGINDVRSWSLVSNQVSDCLVCLQKMLPVPHFLASIGSILCDDEADITMRKGAINLIAERSIETDATSAEGTLFVEMLPDLISVIKKRTELAGDDSQMGDLVLHQSSFRAIDQIVRTFGLSIKDDALSQKRMVFFTPVYNGIVDYLHDNLNRYLSENEEREINLHGQVLSSALLCTSSLICMLKARSLVRLPNLVQSLTTILIRSNRKLSSSNLTFVQNSEHTTASIKLIQMSILRCLIAVAENIPQFLVSHLDMIFAPHALLSPSLYQDQNEEENRLVLDSATRLNTAIATRSPVRQLIPILSRNLIKCFNDKTDTFEISKVAIRLFDVMRNTISHSTRSDVSPLVGKVLNASIQAYSYKCDEEARLQLLHATNNTLLAIVMKLSESQLRQMYSKLREWRGDYDASSINSSDPWRRHGFWSLSALLSKELRSIFLPSLSTVVPDIISELEHAASSLASNDSKQTRGNKRMKVDQNEQLSSNSNSIIPLQTVLYCLENALKADAHEGGTWIRCDDGKRYRMILEPLSKLLQAKVPNDLMISSDMTSKISPYDMLVCGVGTEDHGNVMGCLKAIATAVGNEQLWKPLNHSILEACGNEYRVEVRKAGVNCLLSMIQTLGEEYMVLLPECLPVLSELLEDDDEDIVAVTKECIRQGEELLGESLEL